MKKIRSTALLAALTIAAAGVFSACAGERTVPSKEDVQSEYAAQETNLTPAGEGVIRNFEPPQKGEKIAVITVKGYGEIKIKVFPDAVPNGSENFIGLAEKGYYDELIFHRIIPNFMNQGGDPRGDGTGGKSLWGEKFAGELGEGLYHFSGAVAYAHAANDFSNGSQFYIVNTPEGYNQYSCEMLMASDPAKYNWPQNVIDKYNEVGGVNFLDGDYTVFGQVIEGMDVVREMAKVETNSSDKPLTQVQMESVKVIEWE